MTPKEQARRRRVLENMTPAQLVEAHSAAMLTAEMIWSIVGARLDAMAGDDRLCTAAVGSCHAREMGHSLKALHARADVLAATLGDTLPGGDLVAAPRFGSR